MRTKYLRRFVAVVLTLVLTVMCISSASAANLLEGSINYKWNSSSGSNVMFYWYNMNIPTDASKSISTTALSTGTQYWNAIPSVYPTYGSMTASPSSAWIAHSVPTASWWTNATEWSFGVFYALTYVVDTNGVRINYDSPGTAYRIDYAVVYYNPNVNFTVRTAAANATTVAHEIGHALGFGHQNDTIMQESENALTGLTDTDVDNFYAKYS